MKDLSKKMFNLLIFGVLKRIRTSDLRFRRLLLYPAELSGHMVPLERFELPTFWFVARCAIQLRQRGIWWSKAESNCRHRDFQSPALPTELSSHMAESEGLEPSMRCRTTVFKTARLPIITTLQLAETIRIERMRAYTPNSLANCPLHHLGKSPYLVSEVGFEPTRIAAPVSKTGM